MIRLLRTNKVLTLLFVVLVVLVPFTALYQTPLAAAYTPSSVVLYQFSDGSYHSDNGTVYTGAATAIINSAILSVNKTGSGTVHVLNGTWVLTSSITPMSNVYFLIDSSATISENTPAALGDSISLLLTTQAISNFTVDGGTWNANCSTLSDHRGSGTWSTNFYKYFGISIYSSSSSNITVKNLVVQNVIGQGIDILGAPNSLIQNCTVNYAGDNPITLDVGSTNSIIENCTVVGGQDVGINTWLSDNCTLRFNHVSNVTEYGGDASHWGIAAEGSNNVNIINNTVNDCANNLVSAGGSNNTLIANNTITDNGIVSGSYGMEVQIAYNNIVTNNTINTNGVAFGTYGTSQTVGLQIRNNTFNGKCILGGNNVTYYGNHFYTTDTDGCISIRSANLIEINYNTFTGTNGLADYTQTSNNIHFTYNNFAALTGTKVNLVNCVNVTYANNIGYGNGPPTASIFGTVSSWESSTTDTTDGVLWGSTILGSETIFVNTTCAMAGTNSLEIHSTSRDNGAYISTTHSNLTYAVYSFGLRYDLDFPTYSAQYYVRPVNPSGSTICSIGIIQSTSEGAHLRFTYEYPSTTNVDNASWTPTKNNWYSMTLIITDSATGGYQLYINGTRYINVSGVDVTGSTGIGGLTMGLFGYTAYAPNVYYDNVTLSSQSANLIVGSSLHGSTSPPAGTYAISNGTAMVTATADSGYAFSYWLLNGTQQPDQSNPYYVTLSANTNMTAVFAAEYVPTLSAVGTSFDYSTNPPWFSPGCMAADSNGLGYAVLEENSTGTPTNHTISLIGYTSKNVLLYNEIFLPTIPTVNYVLRNRIWVNNTLGNWVDSGYFYAYPMTRSITVSSEYGSPTSSGLIWYYGNYSTSVTSPVDLGGGVQATCIGYSIDGAVVQSGTNYTFNAVTANHTITYYWSFSSSVYYLSVISDYGSPTSNASITAGDSYATSVSSPYSGTVGTRYVCSGYSIDNGGAGVQYSGVSYTFINVQANHTIYYYWTTQYYLTVTSSSGSPIGGGWYNSSLSASFSVNSPIAGTVGTQYIFNGWTGSGSGSYTGSLNSTSVTITGPITETASWVTQYYLTVTSPYGTTSGSGWYNASGLAYASLDIGISGVNTFSGWSTGGSNYTLSDPIVMSSALTVTAYWTPGPVQYTITVSTSTGGSVSPSGSVLVYEGGDQTFTITPEADYNISAVYVNGVNQGIIVSYTFVNVTSDGTIYVEFIVAFPPTYPDVLNVTPLWQYLYAGNFLGLINAIYLSAFQLESLVVGVILLLIFGPLYVKTRNLLLCSICWILLGSAFIGLVPMLSGLAVILLTIGIASLLYRLVRPN